MSKRHIESGHKEPESDFDEFVLPSWPDLSDLADETDATDCIAIDELPVGAKVRVQTKNSEYWLTVLEGARRRVLVQGGILPTACEAHLEGATDGRTIVHGGWIEVNRSLELACGARRIITSRVSAVSVVKPESRSRH